MQWGISFLGDGWAQLRAPWQKPCCPRYIIPRISSPCSQGHGHVWHQLRIRNVFHAQQVLNFCCTRFGCWKCLSCQTNHAPHIHERLLLLIGQTIAGKGPRPILVKNRFLQCTANKGQPLIFVHPAIVRGQTTVRVLATDCCLELAEQMRVCWLQQPRQFGRHVYESDAQSSCALANCIVDVGSVSIHHKYDMVSLHK